MSEVKRLRIFTWHIHGNYLYYLSQLPHDIYLPIRNEGEEGYGGKTSGFPWPNNIHEISISDIPSLTLDAIIFQSKKNYLTDQYEILTAEQRHLPTFYIEHDPPLEHPTNTKHRVQDGKTVIIQVTHYNALMWDTGEQPVKVIEHGIDLISPASYQGTLAKGVVIINNIDIRGRRLGLDVFQTVQKEIPLDLIGIGTERLGGMGVIPPQELPHVLAQYRFMFSPIRYTSLGLSLIEGMLIGLPLIGLATTELADVITTGVDGLVSTNTKNLIEGMKLLIDEPQIAKELSENVRKMASSRFSIKRFIDDWNEAFEAAGLLGEQEERVPYYPDTFSTTYAGNWS